MEEGAAAKSPLLGNDGGQASESYNTESYNRDPSSSSFTFVVLICTFIFFLGSYSAGNTIGFSSPAESGILHDLALTLAEYSVFVSINLPGAVFGAIWTGKTADVIGRRGAMQVTTVLSITGWLAVALSKGALWLYVGRFLLGFGMGLSSYAGPIYLAEIIPKNVRGAIMSAVPLFVSCGKALFFVIGPLVSWRTLALIALAPYLLPLICLFLIPESPRWLMKIGKDEACEKALRRIRGAKADICQEMAEIKNYTEYTQKVSGDGVSSLFQRKYARCFIIGVGLTAFQQFGGAGGVISYTSSIFESAGFSGQIGSMAVGTTQILTALLGLCSIDRLGRRPLLLMSAAGTCLGCVIIGTSFLFQSLHFGEKLSPVLALAGVLVYLGFYSLGMEGIPLILASEIFPVNIKGVAGSIVNVICMGGGWIVAITFNFMFTWSSSGTFFIFAVICGASVPFIWKMVPETKGRSLEEIQASIAQY